MELKGQMSGASKQTKQIQHMPTVTTSLYHFAQGEMSCGSGAMEELGKGGGGQGKAEWGKVEDCKGQQGLGVLEGKEECGS